MNPSDRGIDLKGLCYGDFWLTMGVANKSRSPLTYMMYWLQKHHSDATKNRWRKLVDWVCKVSRDISKMWDLMLLPGSEHSHWKDLFDMIEGDDEKEATYIALAVKHCLLLRSNFARRVETETSSFPQIILWLIFKAPDVYCENRIKCARDLLAYRLKQVDS